MIDGVKCSCSNLKAETWRRNPLLNFGVTVSETTGEILNERRTAQTGPFSFSISPSEKGGLYCCFSGSIHKYAKGNNFGDFTFAELSENIDRFCTEYGINPETAPIHGLETGVNIELPYSPKRVLKSVICHKGKTFDNLDRRDSRLGLVCERTDYAVKLYDKSYQCKIPDKHILRYELKFYRNRPLEAFGIATLADLKSAEKVSLLISLLLTRLNEIAFFDFSFDTSRMSERKRDKWEKYGNPNYWAGLDRKSAYKARKLYKETIKRYGATDWADVLSGKVSERWEELSGTKQKNGGRFPQISKERKARKKETFSKLEYIADNVPSKKRKEKEKKGCFCVSCGRDISNQRKGSRFCSERLYGKDAKRCRNRDSNRRLSMKRKIKRAESKNLTLEAVYRDGSVNRNVNPGILTFERDRLDEIKKLTVKRDERTD